MWYNRPAPVKSGVIKFKGKVKCNRKFYSVSLEENEFLNVLDDSIHSIVLNDLEFAVRNLQKGESIMYSVAFSVSHEGEAPEEKTETVNITNLLNELKNGKEPD